MAQYPTIPAGKTVTAGLLMSMLPISAAKASSTSRASTSTVTADPELQVAVAANAQYTLDAYLRYTGGQTGDLKCRFTTPSGASGSWGGRVMGTGATLSTDASDSIRVAFNADKAIGCISTTAGQVIVVRGRLITASSGTFSFDWAQNVSDATATVIEADSWFMLTRIA
jgi:hypothetical protein